MTSCHGKSIVALFACACLRVSSTVYADPLTHDDAVRIALERAPLLQAQARRVDAAHEAVTSAGRLPDPELVLGIDNLPIEGADAFSMGGDFMTMRRIGLMQPVPSGAKRNAQRSSAQAYARMSESSLTQTQLDVARATSQAWIGMSSGQELVTALEGLVEQARLLARAQRTELAAGRGTTLDALKAESSVSELKDRLIDARRAFQTSQAELERWIGEPIRELGVAPSTLQIPAAREAVLSSLHRHALVRALDEQISAAQSDVDLAKAQRRPDVSVGLAYQKRGAAYPDMVSLEFRVGLPLFTKNRQDPAIREKQAEVAELQASRESELRMHASEAAAQLAAWDAARERLQLLEEERLPLAQQNSSAAQAAYRSGTVSLAELLESQMREADLLTERAQRKNELGQAWAYLRYLEPENAP
jgi:cobalt-zinc-cadmium efflux system outer membrane protein